jgi:hypothetical protein
VRWLATTAIAVAAVAAVACGSGGPPKVAATVEGASIASDRVERLTTQWLNSQSNQALNGNGVPVDRKQAAKHVLGFVIRSTYLEHLAGQMGVTGNASAVEVAAPDEVPSAEFEAAGWSKADFAQALRDARLSKAIGEKVFPKVAVSDVELRQKYDRNGDFFRQTWRSQVRVAYFDAAEPARQLKARGVKGDAFDAAARELGAKQAGSIGEVSPVTPLPPPVLDAIAGLQAGQVSDPVAGGGGYLVAVADSREDRGAMGFEEAKPDLTRVLEDEKRQNLFYDWFNKRLSEAAVKVAAYYGKWDRTDQLVS